MGYACPVCGTPQVDGRHLANHLAFTAMIHGDDHEAWLAEHAPGWDEAGERELAERVVEAATETEFPQPLDSVVERDGEPNAHSHRHGRGDHDHENGPRDSRSTSDERRARDRTNAALDTYTEGTGSDSSDDERDVAAIVAEARAMTERMRSENDPDEESKPGERNERRSDERDG